MRKAEDPLCLLRSVQRDSSAAFVCLNSQTHTSKETGNGTGSMSIRNCCQGELTQSEGQCGQRPSVVRLLKGLRRPQPFGGMGSLHSLHGYLNGTWSCCRFGSEPTGADQDVPGVRARGGSVQAGGGSSSSSSREPPALTRTAVRPPGHAKLHANANVSS